MRPVRHPPPTFGAPFIHRGTRRREPTYTVEPGRHTLYRKLGGGDVLEDTVNVLRSLLRRHLWGPQQRPTVTLQPDRQQKRPRYRRGLF